VKERFLEQERTETYIHVNKMKFSRINSMTLLLAIVTSTCTTPLAFTPMVGSMTKKITTSSSLVHMAAGGGLEGVELLKTQSNYLQDPLKDVRFFQKNCLCSSNLLVFIYFFLNFSILMYKRPTFLFILLNS